MPPKVLQVSPAVAAARAARRQRQIDEQNRLEAQRIARLRRSAAPIIVPLEGQIRGLEARARQAEINGAGTLQTLIFI
jgi:hypothetical protein